MAGKQASENEKKADLGKSSQKDVGPLQVAFLGAVSIVAAMWNAVTADGTLAAAARQGVDELGTALKAFPDSIQVNEPGTLWHPTQGEIAADRKEGKHRGSYASYSDSSVPRNLWPSEIAKANRSQASNDNSQGKDNGKGHENGHDAGFSM
jgi:hypothetical protein